MADDKDDDIPGALKPINLGDVLPSVVLKNEKDEDVDVAQLAAKKSLVLFLVPKADTRQFFSDFLFSNYLRRKRKG